MISEELVPDIQHRISVDGYTVTAYEFIPAQGSEADTLLCLNGGPGLPCDYLREAHSGLKQEGFRVIAFDQLGTGASDRPADPSLWTIERYVTEVLTVLDALACKQVHLLGHSWGGWLAIEFALTYPQRLKTLILEDTVADIPHLSRELDRLRQALGSETVAMMNRFEAMGRLDHPAYQAAITLLNYRHVCRLDDWPAPLQRSIDDWNMGPYQTMQGPHEFLYNGNLRNWCRVEELKRLTLPALITTGQHDELTPACASRIREGLPHAELHVFPNSSHMPFYEEPEAYYPVLTDFLQRHSGTL
ncbi:proline iminopeptidase-family hydrolase [Gynuella sunshinyii]|uniref:Putative hydrolase or acyltransferase (Alpha/beta hydrolase superfamily) n=1 Tax=Gynuella sunshinyii YC6258 TaxID=1445510 RepID=A0A0C5VAW6_9GAMM|nr:proline iminopeptidase-family hydrolase [Gynuella sunshinyii]AJQ96490.1 putative hydrolase or acyltransferase (alpha/beta hydrolase superfamily) [Gynuella sunshinyii YC6258]